MELLEEEGDEIIEESNLFVKVFGGLHNYVYYGIIFILAFHIAVFAYWVYRMFREVNRNDDKRANID